MARRHAQFNGSRASNHPSIPDINHAGHHHRPVRVVATCIFKKAHKEGEKSMSLRRFRVVLKQLVQAEEIALRTTEAALADRGNAELAIAANRKAKQLCLLRRRTRRQVEQKNGQRAVAKAILAIVPA